MDWEEACRILGVNPTASPEEIRQQWHYKAQLLHPDATIGKSESIRKKAEEEFKLVKQAYEFLINPLNNPFTNPPKLKISPKHIRFKDVEIGQKKTTSFEIDSIGGTYTNIWFETEPCPWLSVTSFKSTTTERLPAEVTIECTGIGDPGKQYSCKLPVRLENEKTKLKDEAILDIELWIQAGRPISGTDTARPKRTLLDLTPLTLGIESPKGRMKPIIPCDTAIPTSRNVTITTAKDYQASMVIRVLAGERPMAADNHTLGRFVLDGIPRAPRGVPQIEVTFHIDADGILYVKARDKGTGKEQEITTTASSGLSGEEIKKMRREAEDVTRKEKLELMKRAKCPDCGRSLSFDYWVLLWRCTNHKCKGKKKYTYEELR
jgi:hypothetical protein